MKSDSNYVELNLLRAGPPLPFTPPIVGPYYDAVSRVDDRSRVGTWEWSLREEMPIVPIPLREPDSDAELDLKSIVDTVYDDGGFARMIYQHSPEPPLSAEEESWVQALAVA